MVLGDGQPVTVVVGVDLARVNARVKTLAQAQSADIGQRLEREGVAVVTGAGRLDGPQRVVADLPDGGTETFEADAVLVSTGAHPRVLPGARARRRADPHVDPALRAGRACPSGWSWSGPASPARSSPRRTTRSAADVVLVSSPRPRAAG